MMDRRASLGTLAGGLLAAPLATGAQPAGKVYRIGHLSGSGMVASKVRALGYIEAQHWTLEERYAEGKVERLPALAQEIVSRDPDALLVSTTPGNLAAKAARAGDGHRGRYQPRCSLSPACPRPSAARPCRCGFPRIAPHPALTGRRELRADTDRTASTRRCPVDTGRRPCQRVDDRASTLRPRRHEST